jgi:uncharacterized Zn finger protein (UPF0148 family)
MSDTDADDSGFDKEAERERLREKYGEDGEDQAATERMSELLLQGATMTNRHCGDCGNPIFRYEGQSFCAVCEAARPADGQATQTEGSTAPDQRSVDSSASAGESSQDSREGAPETEIADRMRDRAESTSEPSNPAEADARPDPETAGPDEVAAPDTVTSRGAPRPEGPTGDRGADLQSARMSLLRTLNRMADQAESTAEVDRSRDYLAAAREAAEALAALDGVRQK